MKGGPICTSETNKYEINLVVETFKKLNEISNMKGASAHIK